jgi:protocatechuate 3,4-dioxygenase beta subunit
MLLVLALLVQPQGPPRDQPTPPQIGTAVIRGRIVAADSGRPLRRARIVVSAPELGSARLTSTDANGRYEITGLPPGRYSISATRNGFLSQQHGQRRPLEQGRPLQLGDGQIVNGVDFMLPRVSVISGRVIDEAGEPMGGVTVYAMRPAYFQGRRTVVPATGGSQTVRTDETGQYRIIGIAPGTYYVMAMLRETWATNEGGVERTFGYAATYYPGAGNVGGARPVAVGIGEEVGPIEIPLIPGRAAAVSGMALDSRGRPFVSARVEVLQEFRSPSAITAFSTARDAVAADGTFTVKDVPPGEYKLVVSGGIDGTMEAASTVITIDGVDISNLALRASGGWTLSGRVTDERGTTPSIPPSQVRLAGQTLAGDPRSQARAGRAIDKDWTFAFAGIFGPARVLVIVPDGWAVKSILRAGRDIGDEPIEGGSGEEVSDVQIVVTNRVTTLSGDVRGARGAALDEGTVVVFAEDAARWFEASRWVRTARPDQQGHYRISGLPPGDYLAVALDYVEDGLWNDPEYLQSIRRYAERFTLGDGGSRTLALKLVAP